LSWESYRSVGRGMRLGGHKLDFPRCSECLTSGLYRGFANAEGAVDTERLARRGMEGWDLNGSQNESRVPISM
jgi:hypothetical protein